MRGTERCDMAHKALQKQPAAVCDSIPSGENVECLHRHFQMRQQIPRLKDCIAAVRKLSHLGDDQDAGDEDEGGVESVVQCEPPEPQEVEAVLDFMYDLDRFNRGVRARLDRRETKVPEEVAFEAVCTRPRAPDLAQPLDRKLPVQEGARVVVA